MKILAIETSCDDTSCAIIDEHKRILSNITHSQAGIHEKYYGIVPELASRHHLENINFIVSCALKDSKQKLNDIDAFAVTQGPGLAGSLLIGLMTAKTFASYFNKPLVPVNHLKAHIWANFIKNDNKNFVPEFPAIVLLVSGGHTELCLMKGFDSINILGRTRDDAVGEAFDKVAKLLDLGYPGGPIIDTLSKKTDKRIHFTRPYLPGSYDFSFSGLKTAVLYYVKKRNEKLNAQEKNIIAASFQDTAVEVLVKKTIKAAKEYNAKCIMVSGGVAANSKLRKDLALEAEKNNISVNFPSKELCADNAGMVGAVAVDKIKEKGDKFYKDKLDNEPLFYKVNPGMKLV